MEKNNKENMNKYKRATKMVAINPTMSIINLTVSGLNTSIKRQRFSKRISQKNNNHSIFSTRKPKSQID